MRVRACLITLWLALVLPHANAGNWPQWRGPKASGVSDETGLPTEWNPARNIAWKRELPGKGNSSPIVWNDRVFLTAETQDQLLVLCIRRDSGEILWKRGVPAVQRTKTHPWNGYASATPATDGERVYALFGPTGVVAFDLDGNQVWHCPLGDLMSEWGIASSPYLDGKTLYVSIDHDLTSFIAAIDTVTGKVHWRTDRETGRSYSSPVLSEAGGHRELVISGDHRVSAYNAETGEPLWFCKGLTKWVTPTVVSGQGLIYAVSGRDGPVLALRPGGKGDVAGSHVAWRVDSGAPYLPSPLLYQGHFYMLNDNGVLSCFEAETGKKCYQTRVGSRGNHSASPVAADGKIYVLSEEGVCTVVKAGAEFQVIAVNQMEGLFRASIAVSNGRLFLRSQGTLYCIGAK